MTRDQAAQFQTWFYSMSASGLAMGRNQFQLLIDTEWGQLLHTLQLTPDTFSQTQEAHNVFSYQATAIARKVPIPQWWLDHEDLVNSEFFAQRSLFDLVVNEQIPPLYNLDGVTEAAEAWYHSMNTTLYQNLGQQ